MIATKQLSVEQILKQTNVPGTIIRKRNAAYYVSFNIHAILFDQQSIFLFWKSCNQYHLKPVAKTFLGRVTAVKFLDENNTTHVA